MQATGDDYIFIENFDGKVTCPESLCISLCDRHKGIGGYGIVLIENSDIADAKMRIFNSDGSEGKMAGNCIRSAAKYLYDNDIAKKDVISVETASGVKEIAVYTGGGEVTLAEVNMGKAYFSPEKLPVNLPGEKILDRPVSIAGNTYNITCVGIGNPHCVFWYRE